MTKQTTKNTGIGAIGFLVAALISAGFAVYLVAMLVKDKGLKREPMATVLVAARDVSAGTNVTAADVRAIQIAQSQVPPDAITSLTELFGEGPTAKIPVTSTGMVQGDFIIRSRFADSAHGTAMAAKVAPGMRAIAVTVDNAIARSRLVFPGARVDIVGTFRNINASSSFSRVLVENVRVLSLEDQTDVETYQSKKGDRDQRDHDAVVTVEVTPEQSEVVALAAREGKLDIMLRNSTDVADINTKGAQTEQLIGKALPGQGGAAASDGPGEPTRRSESRSRRSRPEVRKAEETAPKLESNGGGAIEVLGRGGKR
jgi:pilus assembly protein CpaB